MDIKAYQALLDRYEQLEKAPVKALSDDDRRSLIFYRAERQYLETGNINVVAAPRQARNWIVNVTHLDEFDGNSGSAPHKQPGPLRDASAEEENRLAEWVSHSRENWDTLCSYQQERLLCIPSFELDPHGKQWDDQVAAYKKVVERSGRAPVVTSDADDERLSARWAARVRANWRRGLLAKHRADEAGGLKFWWWEK